MMHGGLMQYIDQEWEYGALAVIDWHQATGPSWHQKTEQTGQPLHLQWRIHNLVTAPTLHCGGVG